jgi:hypothetical protein
MKRSEFYAAMAIVIIMCSMSTVFAVSYQPQIIQPTKPYEANYQVNADANTYYTALDITGTGTLNRLSIASVANNNANVSYKITIDGTSYEKTAIDQTYNKFLRSNGPKDSTTGRLGIIDFNSIIYFKTSLKIEIKTSTAEYIGTIVNYALE